MTKKTFPIDSDNVQAVRDHIQQEFTRKSWWPAEGPLQAKEEFETAQHSAETLAEWCSKWLDGSQWRQLRLALDKGDTPTTTVG